MRAAETQILHDKGGASDAAWDRVGRARLGPLGSHGHIEGFTMPIHSAIGQPTQWIRPK